MRETPLSLCEREFILKALSEKQRIDGRECYDYRHIKVSFGVDRGCCCVQLGKTRVMTQISCEVTPPKQARPSEGILFVNVELSPMAAPQFEPGRPSEYGTEISRILERCIKESRCVDTESLCIMAGLKVWTIRADIHVLNHDGNLIDCCSISAIAALAHFRRPDVTVSGEEVTIHSLEDRDPVPLSVHHMPICVTFGFYEQGKFVLVDPNEREERVMDGKMVIGMNKHREICTLQMTGSMLLFKEQVLRCSNIAVVKVAEVTELIQQALENDSKARSAGEKFGFAASVITRHVTAHGAGESEVDMQEVEAMTQAAGQQRASEQSGGSGSEEEEEEEAFESKLISKEENTVTIGEGGADVWRASPAALGEGGANTWLADDGRAEELEQEQKMLWQNIQSHKQAPSTAKTPSKGTAATYDDSSDEEAETVTLMADDVDIRSGKSQQEPQSIDLTSALKKTSRSKKQRAKMS